MPPRSGSPLQSTPSGARTTTLQGLLIVTIVVAALYFGRDVLLPLALAILLSFVLTPPLLLLRRIKLPRVAAVGIVVGAAFAVIVALGWLMSREVTELATDLPNYRYALYREDQGLPRNHGALAGAEKSGRRSLRPAKGACRARGRSPVSACA